MVEPRFHLDLDRSESWSSPVVATKILSPFLSDPSHTPERRGSPLPDTSDNLNSSGFLEDDLVGVVRQRPRGELAADEHSRPPAKGLQKYLSRFDDAMKLRGQLANEKAAQESSSETEELDSFRLFRLVGSVILAVFVRVFACKYLVRIFVVVDIIVVIEPLNFPVHYPKFEFVSAEKHGNFGYLNSIFCYSKW